MHHVMGHDVMISLGEESISEVVLLFGTIRLVVFGKEVLESNLNFVDWGSKESRTLRG